jgi:hypothetical protein
MNGRPQLLLEAGALINAEAHPHGKVIAECQLALLARRPALLPAVVFAQVWRASPRQHALSKIRQMCRIITFTSKILMPLVRRSRVDETGGASPADVVLFWRGLSPSQRLTLEPAPVGYSGLSPYRARVSDS